MVYSTQKFNWIKSNIFTFSSVFVLVLAVMTIKINGLGYYVLFLAFMD